MRYSNLFGLTTSALALLASACNPPASTTTSSKAATAAAAADTAGQGLTPDLSADLCARLPPEQIAEYKADHDLFSSAPGLEPQFEKGHSFTDGDTIRFKWAQASNQRLTLRVTALLRCSPLGLMRSPLYETPAGSGLVSVPLGISGGGRSYPTGTPGLVEVSTTEVTDAKTLQGKTTVLGRYTVRLTGPAD